MCNRKRTVPRRRTRHAALQDITHSVTAFTGTM